MDYKDYENRGRKKFRENAEVILGYTGYEFTPNAYDRADVVLSKSKAIYEIKDRDIPINSRQSYMLEKKKWDGMCKYYNNFDKYYVTFFQDGWVVIWNLSKLSPSFDKRWTEGYFTQTTVNYSKDKVKKEYLDLNLNEAEAIYHNKERISNNYNVRRDL